MSPGEPVTTTVGTVRRGLDVLGLDREAFVERITATLPEKPPNYEAVIAANRGVESPPDETAAIELELGPNRCAANGRRVDGGRLRRLSVGSGVPGCWGCQSGPLLVVNENEPLRLGVTEAQIDSVTGRTDLLPAVIADEQRLKDAAVAVGVRAANSRGVFVHGGPAAGALSNQSVRQRSELLGRHRALGPRLPCLRVRSPQYINRLTVATGGTNIGARFTPHARTASRFTASAYASAIRVGSGSL